METKLTLRMDKNIINAAKRFAREHHTSLSSLVADYFRRLVMNNTREQQPTPILAEITGVLKKTSGSRENWQEEYHQHIEEKYR